MTEAEWKNGLARLAGDVEIPDPNDEPKTLMVPLMARDVAEADMPGNPAWYGKILIQQFDPAGESKGWSLSSTRQTRDAAYHYLAKASEVNLVEESEAVL